MAVVVGVDEEDESRVRLSKAVETEEPPNGLPRGPVVDVGFARVADAGEEISVWFKEEVLG